MNINMTLTCNTCEQDIDCRIGLSNRESQPLSFACPNCASLIRVTLSSKTPMMLVGAKRLDAKNYGLFDGRNPFIDLHIDFPVWVNEYIPGSTPFMVAMQKININQPNESLKRKLMGFHTERLNQLNDLHGKAPDIRTILRLYRGKNKQLFKKSAGDFLSLDLGQSLKPQDINAALYLFVSYVFKPFIHHDGVKTLVEDFTGLIYRLSSQNKDGFNVFIDHIIETKFLESIQSDCLELYPEIFDAELPLRPALFLDLLDGFERGKVATRVSNKEFQSYKDLYKDIAEVFGRQLILVAGINNIIHRNGHNNFATPKDGKPLSSLDKFADKTLSDKFKYLDDCWYDIDRTMVDTNVRNSIAHFTAEYDEITQLITYFPEMDGVRQGAGETMYFLDFMRMLLLLFREVHDLHHVIKALFFYEYLIRFNQRNKI